ncbi:ABC transporter ATP-binding protein [Pseudomonas thivervalensis]|uniref:ABC transporter ATP-binding protein n=1 Tax=Pseudomonas thivervalensis TaxID=86265 RepID=UPI00069DC9D0|nr:ABC transporter ATP-binding protein [Pseudomonas thivervalensis]OAB49408.1 oligopeptide transporter ATP-binding component [Pseudomonas thivervalensis]SDF74250.1 peptide/nickel transport system ATP-binding protein [Pseudomonas thivervalensis]
MINESLQPSTPERPAASNNDAAQEWVLEVEGLTVSFPGLFKTVKAVRGIDLKVRRGEILGLVGESGSGKSMTAMSCLGLMPDAARLGGSVKVAGQQVNGASASQLADLRGGGAAMIFQNPMKALNPFFTVGRQMFDVIGCHRQLSKAQIRAEALNSLEAVSMPDPSLALAKYPHQMSGGQLQRVVIAMALACRPKLLIADEPTTALDVTVQAQIIALLRKLAQEQDLAILFITHNLGVMASLCDRVAVMYAGEVVESGPVGQVFKRPAHPYTLKLMGTVPKLGQGSQPLGFIPGQVPNMAVPPAGCAFNPRCERATGRCVQAAPRVEIGEGHWAACHNTLVKV